MIERYFLSLINFLQRHQGLFFSTVLITVFSLFIGFQYQSYSQRHHHQLSDRFFEIVGQANYPGNDQSLQAFKKSNMRSIYSDFIRLQQAKYYYDKKDQEKSERLLEETVQYTKSDDIRSLAAYRLAILLKGHDAVRALDYTNKVASKSMSTLKSLLKAEIFESMGEESKALLEINSVTTNAISQLNDSVDDFLLIELANHHKRKLLQNNDQSS